MAKRNLEPEVHYFMDHGSYSRYPELSRDWEEIDCSNENCVNNNNFSKKCLVPSLAKIGSDGKCKGYTSKNKVEPKQKPRTATSDLEIE